jgi:meiosis induction protein kinase IME2/SME1
VAHGDASKPAESDAAKTSKKIGRQLSVNSNGNHYSDVHRQEAERMLNGSGNTTPTTKESFFSHLRKRARRLSGRNQAAAPSDDVEANAGCIPWSNRSSIALDGANVNEPKPHSDLSELDKALQSVKYSLDSSTHNVPVHLNAGAEGSIKRQSMPQTTSTNPGPISSRTRRALQMTSHPVHRYETPEEEDELLDEVLHSTHKAARRLALTQSLAGQPTSVGQRQTDSSRALPSPYPTPSPTAKADGYFETPVKQVAARTDANSNRHWPTPPYEESEWNQKASTQYFSGSNYI